MIKTSDEGSVRNKRIKFVLVRNLSSTPEGMWVSGGPGRLYRHEGTTHIHLMGKWLGPWDGLDALEKKFLLYPPPPPPPLLSVLFITPFFFIS